MTRDFNKEIKDTAERKYAYDFDDTLRNYMFRSFAPYLKGGRALELGCYRGDVTVHLVEHYDDLTVVEAASESLALTRERVKKPVTYIHSTFEEAALKGTFDAIFLIHTLEHIEHPVAVLKRVREWLSPGGALFLAVPNAMAPSRQIAVKMGLIPSPTSVTPGEKEHGHFRTYDFASLEAHVKEAGLSVSHRSGVFFKGLANFQIDLALKAGIISKEYMDGCYALGEDYPDLCASLFLLCGK